MKNKRNENMTFVYPCWFNSDDKENIQKNKSF